MSEEDVESTAGEQADDELDLEARELCPDGSCTGVIGEDGRCRICGRPREGARTAAAASLPGDEGAGGTEAAGADDLSDDLADEGAGPDEDRRLCPDGNCIGLIGSDGRCKVCGQAAGVE